MRSLSKFLCIFLSLIILCGTLSAGIYATADSEDTGQDSAERTGRTDPPTRTVYHFYFANVNDGDLFSYNGSTLTETRYLSGNSNSHYYQQWELYYNSSGDYYAILPYGGDRPYALSVDPSSNAISIQSYDSSDVKQRWCFSLQGNGNIAITSKATGTAANGKSILISGNSATVVQSSFSIYYILEYDTWVAPTSISYQDFEIAPTATRIIHPVSQTHAQIPPSLIQFSASNNNITVSGNTVTGVHEGEATLYLTEKVTGVHSNVHVTVSSISNGIYFFKNKQNADYARVKYGNMSSGTNIVQYDFDGSEYERWRISLDTDDGYYRISSLGLDERYLTVKDSSSALNQEIVLGDDPSEDGAKWSITRSSSGGYILTPKTGENAGGSGVDYVLATSTSNGTNNAKLIQGKYVYNTSYRDEWYLQKTILNCWYANDSEHSNYTNMVAYWDHTPSVFYYDRTPTNNFNFDISVECALSQWENALQISFADGYSEINTDISTTSETRDDVFDFFDNLAEGTVGVTDNYFVEGYSYETEWGSKYITIKKLRLTNMYIISYSYNDNVLKEILSHEYGHALGYIGHSSVSNDVMYYSTHSSYLLKNNDVNHIKQVYDYFN
ncbi:MAG: RICIN domain-containing protein [Firmicutes bacterium]|nr:RICIN domain-containing protein [Candidatus Colimorpha enterica]